MCEQLKERIKKHEGYRDTVYKCSAGKRTIGYGHLIRANQNFEDGVKYPKERLDKLFERDFTNAHNAAYRLHNKFIGTNDMKQSTYEVLVEMVFQLGEGSVSRFKNMWKAIEEEDFEEASKQMLDSRWHKQTPKRCEELAAIMASCQGG